LQEGIDGFLEENSFDEIFEFVAIYVRRMYSDAHLRKNMKKFVNKTFLEMITPSDIAYVLSLIKNSQEVWEQNKRCVENSHKAGGEKKLRPIFTSGKGKKRVFGENVWTREGLEYFYTAEKNWKVVYTTRSMFSKLATEWEHWEPEDKTWKDPIRTHWLGDDEIFDLETQRAKKRGEEKDWWDKEGEDGYTSELEKIDWDWDDTVRGKGEGKTNDDNISQTGGDQGTSDEINKTNNIGETSGNVDNGEEVSGETKRGERGGNEKKRKRGGNR